MAVGDNTANSIIWVPGESKGYGIAGPSAGLKNVPAAVSGLSLNDANAQHGAVVIAEAYTDVLHARLVASGYLPV